MKKRVQLGYAGGFKPGVPGKARQLREVVHTKGTKKTPQKGSAVPDRVEHPYPSGPVVLVKGPASKLRGQARKAALDDHLKKWGKLGKYRDEGKPVVHRHSVANVSHRESAADKAKRNRDEWSKGLERHRQAQERLAKVLGVEVTQRQFAEYMELTEQALRK